ncbi:MAG: type I restriction-modification system subunit M [Firmicutes bacterium]|jgi:type I restriction enzyme M protein|nr:type I restriction-modification system subunit M [Bacillota bacterium]
MADIRKEQDREELFRTIYKIATDLVHAGHVSEWDFKSYVLGTMFYRYISENFTAYINAYEHEAGNTDFDYAKISDEIAETIRDDMIQTKGFFILPSELFCNVRARADQDENLNETLERVFAHIESSAASGDAENDFAGLFDDFDVNSKSIGETVAKRNKVLAALLNGVDKMPLFLTDGVNPDLFGDAYEYLMGMYAANAGKKGGQYFTPADVSELLARLGTIGKTRINKVYDPACGSGSLLLKVEKVLGRDNIEGGFFGQEIDLTTYNLCRINMFLHNIEFDRFSIVREDTLLSPQHWDDQPFDLIVSNPPFSVPWEGKKNPLLINDPRFSPAGVLAPTSKGDMAFIMHSLSWLANDGAAAIVCFPGIMYRGGAEKKIRKYLVDNNYIDAIIQLPSNLFLNVTISVDIMLLKKNKTDNSIIFVDASKEFVKVTKNNRFSEDNIQCIVSAVAERKDEQYFSRLVSNDEVGNEQNEYNLSVSTYVEQEDTREKIDIAKLNAEIAEIVAREQVLRDEIAKIIAEIEVQ